MIGSVPRSAFYPETGRKGQGRTGAAGRALAVVVLGALGVSACEDLSRFTTAAGQSYCGTIALGAAFRRGFTPRAQMRLSLDAAAIDGPDSPGKVSTQELRDADDGGEVRLLDEAPLRPIPPLAHDVLSRPDLGEGRVRTALFAVSPADPLAEGLVAAVSLRSDGDVEVRLLRPGASDDAASLPEGRRPLFGLFTLRRQSGRCF
jgi:hypothetical protein